VRTLTRPDSSSNGRQLPEREEQVAALFEVVCRTVDAVGRLKLSNKAKSNAINRRQKPKADQDEKDAAEVREREVRAATGSCGEAHPLRDGG
jgi:hypothetical protein